MSSWTGFYAAGLGAPPAVSLHEPGLAARMVGRRLRMKGIAWEDLEEAVGRALARGKFEDPSP